MIVEVIPLARLPKNLSIFDYEVPQNFEGQIRIGQIVRIPFRGKKMSGLVTALKDIPAETKSTIKPFIKILDTGKNIDANHLDLLRWFADYYLISPALVLKTFLPEPPLKISNFKVKQKQLATSLRVVKTDLQEIQDNFRKIVSSEKSHFLFHTYDFKNKIAVFLKCAEKILLENKSIIFLLPQVPDVAAVIPYFINLFPDKIAELHGELSKTDYWREWEKIKSGRAKIVIGTRSALFAPLQNLGLIVIDNEEASDFKQSDQNPRYDARDVAMKLAELTGAKIVFASQSPRPEIYFLAKKNQDFVYLPPKIRAHSPAKLVDMNGEIQNKNFSFLSGKLKEEISETLGKKQKIILLLNRRGLSTMIVCRDCEHIFLCKNCQAPLACHDDERNLPSQFVCHSCGTREPMSLVCPNCRGTAIKYIGVGTQTVEREIKKLFPQAKVLRIDKDAPISNIQYQIAEADIFIGTQFFIRNYLPQIKNIGLVGVISADTLIYRPDFRSGEKIFSWLTGIINFAGERKSSVIIQTFFPNDFSIRSAADGKPESFYAEELENRQALRYPPFGRLIKLVYACPSEKTCAEEAARLFKVLENELNKKAEMSLEEKPRREKSKFFSKIIIKFSKESSAAMREALKKTVPDSWTIDINPEGII
jgi:primosomal protein N' (replication factor Y)